MRFISTKTHGVLDYLMGLLLIVSPWLFDFAGNSTAMNVSLVLGVFTILYSLFTNYEFGVVKYLSMPAHLMLDALGGFLLAISPWLFGFSNYVFVPHLILGIIEVGAAVMTVTRSYRAHADTGEHAH